MKYDYLVENQEGDSFTRVPRDDQEYGLNHAVRSTRMIEVLARIGLQDGFLRQYMAQLAMTGTVSKDLLIVEGQTIKEEFDTVYEHIKRTEEDEFGFETDVTMTGDTLPEEEKAWWALGAGYGIRVLDRNGHTDILLDSFNIESPITPAGTLVNPAVLGFPLIGVVEAVEKVPGLDTYGLTCFVEQRAVTYDEDGKPIHVDDTRHLTLGSIDEFAEFKPFVTLLRPFGEEKDLF